MHLVTEVSRAEAKHLAVARLIMHLVTEVSHAAAKALAMARLMTHLATEIRSAPTMTSSRFDREWHE